MLLVAEYRLSCACGEAIPVAVGQAGGEIGCPRCGRRLAIPTLRQLRELPPWGNFEAESAGGGPTGLQDGRRGGGGGGAETARARWGRAEAVLAAGAIVAVVSLIVAAWLIRPVTGGIDAAVIRAAVERASMTDVYRAWRSFADAGVARGETPDEERVRRITRSRVTLAVAVGLLGGIGGLTAVGAAVAIVARGRLGRPADREFHARSGP